MNDLGTHEHPEVVSQEFRPLARTTRSLGVPFASFAVNAVPAVAVVATLASVDARSPSTHRPRNSVMSLLLFEHALHCRLDMNPPGVEERNPDVADVAEDERQLRPAQDQAVYPVLLTHPVDHGQ